MKSSEKKRKKKKIPSRIISSFEKASTKKTQSLFDPPYIPKRIKYNILSPTLNEPKKKKKNSTIHITIPRRKSWSARGIDNVSIIDNRDLLEDAAAKFTTGGAQFARLYPRGGLTVFLLLPGSEKLLT